MGLFDFFKKKKEIITEEKLSIKEEAINYQSLIDISKILTENNIEAVNSISLLVNSPENFEAKFFNWLELTDFSVKDNPELIAAFLLTGYDTPYDFGSYIDWKEATEDIIWSLMPSITNKSYPLNIEDISFSGNEFTDEALYQINDYLIDKGFVLTAWDTDSDSYHLFIVKDTDYQQLISLGKSINIRFFTFKMTTQDSKQVIIEA